MAAPLPDNEAERLEALRRYHVLDTLPEAEFDDIVRIVADVCGTPIAVVNLIDQGRQWFKAEIGLGVRETPLEVSICAHAILQRDVLVVRDTREDERFRGNPLVTGAPHLRFYAGALLETADGFPLGTLCVLDHAPRELSESQIGTLRALARQVMALLELKRANAAQGKLLAELAQAAEDRALLLRELQHRVKNNLQMIDGLLALHGPKEGAAQALLSGVRRRLRALAMIDEQLTAGRPQGAIDLAAYLRHLCGNLVAFNGGPGGAARLDFRLGEMTVRPELALPIGLIVNEFITNSFKHAFNGGAGNGGAGNGGAGNGGAGGGGAGTVTVRLDRLGELAVRIVLADDGPGLPAGPAGEPGRAGGLGMRIIATLARQIGAEAAWTADGGTTLSLILDTAEAAGGEASADRPA